MRPKSTKPSLAITLAMLLPLAACSSSSSDKTPLTYEAFSAKLCDLQMPCCAAQALPSDGMACRRTTNLFSSLVVFDPVAAEACLAELAAAQASPTFCIDIVDAPKGSCAQATKEKRGTKQLGDVCKSDNDCAEPASTQVHCTGDQFEGTSGICQKLVPGKPGDGPCLGSRFLGDGISYTAQEQTKSLSSVVLCDEELICNKDTLKCEVRPPPKPKFGVGADCTGSNQWRFCGKEAYCDEEGGVCVARKPVGSACSDSVECVADVANCPFDTNVCTSTRLVGAACESRSQCAYDCIAGTCVAEPKPEETSSAYCDTFDQCETEKFCDLQTNKCVTRKPDAAVCEGPNECKAEVSYCAIDTGFCTPKRPNGMACVDDVQCIGKCRNGKCASDFGNDLTWSFVCGGD